VADESERLAHPYRALHEIERVAAAATAEPYWRVAMAIVDEATAALRTATIFGAPEWAVPHTKLRASVDGIAAWHAKISRRLRGDRQFLTTLLGASSALTGVLVAVLPERLRWTAYTFVGGLAVSALLMLSVVQARITRLNQLGKALDGVIAVCARLPPPPAPVRVDPGVTTEAADDALPSTGGRPAVVRERGKP